MNPFCVPLTSNYSDKIVEDWASDSCARCNTKLFRKIWKEEPLVKHFGICDDNIKIVYK
jgi:hypothetical protein